MGGTKSLIRKVVFPSWCSRVPGLRGQPHPRDAVRGPARPGTGAPQLSGCSPCGPAPAVCHSGPPVLGKQLPFCRSATSASPRPASPLSIPPCGVSANSLALRHIPAGCAQGGGVVAFRLSGPPIVFSLSQLGNVPGPQMLSVLPATKDSSVLLVGLSLWLVIVNYASGP